MSTNDFFHGEYVDDEFCKFFQFPLDFGQFLVTLGVIKVADLAEVFDYEETLNEVKKNLPFLLYCRFINRVKVQCTHLKTKDNKEEEENLASDPGESEEDDSSYQTLDDSSESEPDEDDDDDDEGEAGYKNDTERYEEDGDEERYWRADRMELDCSFAAIVPGERKKKYVKNDWSKPTVIVNRADHSSDKEAKKKARDGFKNGIDNKFQHVSLATSKKSLHCN